MDQQQFIPMVTWVLIALNVGASLYALNNRPVFERYMFWMGPMRRWNQWDRMVTSGFLHVNGGHLLINMYVLWMFGGILEAELGHIGFLIVYMAGLLGGNFWEYVDKKDNPNYRAVGASGATSGLVLAYVLYFPFNMLYFFGVIPLPGIVMGTLFIVGSWWFSKRPNTMIGHGAHLGGALAGFVATAIIDPAALGNFSNQLSNYIN